MSQSPLEHYQQKLKAGELSIDAQQDAAIKALERLYGEMIDDRLEMMEKNALSSIIHYLSSTFQRRQPVKGIYMYGGVGRGKSMLMDLFFEAVPETLKKRRVHFHEFMIETHDWLHKGRGRNMEALLPSYAKHVAKETRLLCFDEFHVSDVADAMILGRLFTALLDKGVIVVATSNWIPDRLYEGGLQRELFLPFIDLLKNRLEVVHLDSGADYRLSGVSEEDLYLWPLGKATAQKVDDIFAGLTDCEVPKAEVITVKGREIEAMAASGIARFTFAQLCEQPHGAEDYLAISKKFHTVFVENIPRLGYDRRNEAKRLMTLVDVLYDNQNCLIITADAPPDKLYVGKDHSFDFDRTVSRLIEMQSSNYLDHGGTNILTTEDAENAEFFERGEAEERSV